MRKALVSLVATAGMLALFTGSAAAAEGDEITVSVMSHYCSPDIQSEADFKAVEAKGQGNPVAALAQTVLACPTGVNPGDASTNGVKTGPKDFSFTVEHSGGTADMPRNSTAAKLCESDIKLDANGDGDVSKDVCLDISHYMFKSVTSGEVTVHETPDPDFRFGTLRFTPPAIDKNNDEESLVSFRDGVIRLDTADDADGMVMLHVYNFAGMPATDTEGTAEELSASGASLAPAAFVLALGALAGAVFALKRRTA